MVNGASSLVRCCSEDAKRLCANPTLVGDSRLQVGCRN